VRKVKTLVDPCPHFVRQAAKYDHLLELQSNTQRFKRNERYIKYNPAKQYWCVYTHRDTPQICGRYNNVIDAVFYALK
jgi:hypothetical protein